MSFLGNKKKSRIDCLFSELHPYNGRINIVMRIVLASAIVMIVSQFLQIPQLAISLIVIFFVTQSNVVLTKITGAMFILGSTIAIGASILIIMYTYDSPLLRLLLSISVFLICTFLMRTTKIGAIFFMMALVVIYVQSLVDLTDQAELLIREALWVWVAVNYAILVTLVVNTLFLPLEPSIQFKTAIINELAIIDALLTEKNHELRTTPNTSSVGRGSINLNQLLKYTVMRDDSFRQHQVEYLALVTTISQLHVLAYQLPSVWSTDDIRQAAHTIKLACLQLTQSIKTETNFQLSAQVTNIQQGELPSSLYEMAVVLRVYADKSAYSTQPHLPDINTPLLAKDAFSNPIYVQFALKTALATFSCYLFYVFTDWDGIHTIMLTCVIMAQPGLGATHQRGKLRLFGAAVGCLLALISLIWIIPRLDTIVGILLMALPVIALGGWVAAGSEKISYAGTQIVFTYSLILLNNFGPVTDLIETRDRIIGIILGILVSLFIHNHLWPEFEGQSLRQQLANLIKDSSDRLNNYTTKRVDIEIWSKLDMCEIVAARSALEPTWQIADPIHGHFNQITQLLLLQVRTILLAEDSFRVIYLHSKEQLTGAAQEKLSVIIGEYETALKTYAHNLANAPLKLAHPYLTTPDLTQIKSSELIVAINALTSAINGLPSL